MFLRSVNDAALYSRCQIRAQVCVRCLASPFLIPCRKRFLARTASSTSDKSEPSGPKIESSQLPSRAKRFTGGVELLDIDTLGDRSHVIVLPETKERKAGRLVEHQDESRQLNSQSEILEEIRKESSRHERQSEVWTNIDNIRSSHKSGDTLYPVDWDKLRSVLENGFTTKQLLTYVKQNGQKEQPPPSKEQACEEEGPRWRPGTSLYLELGPDARITNSGRVMSHRPGKLSNAEGKTFLAERIMRDCWQLTLQNEIGQVDYRAPTSHVSALLLSKSKPLKVLAESHNVLIDVTSEFGLLRITGTRSDSLQAYTAVDDLVFSIRSKKVLLAKEGWIFDKINGKRMGKRFLKNLQGRYGIYCRPDKAASTVLCYFLEENKSAAIEFCRNLWLASSVDDASHDQPRFTYFPENQDANLYTVESPDFMSWPNRQRNWLRWAEPYVDFDERSGRIARRPPATIYSKEPHAPLNQIGEELFKNFQAGDELTTDIVKASVGKHVFSGLKSGDVQMSFSELKPIDTTMFIADVPNTLSFLKTLWPAENNGVVHRMRLYPAPNTEMRYRLPVIELELELSENEQTQGSLVNPTLKKATAIITEKHADLLLPETALDVRFTREVHYDILGGHMVTPVASESNPIQSSLVECLSGLQFMLPVSGPQPPIPLSCNITLPRAIVTFEPNSYLTKGVRQPLESARDEGFIEAMYIFPPIGSVSAGRIARFNYKDLELQFSNSRMGPLFPNQAVNLELSIGLNHDESARLMTLPSYGPPSSKEDKLQSIKGWFTPLYTRACQLAFELSAHK